MSRDVARAILDLVREPLSDDEVKRIARETARETVKGIFDVLALVALSIVGFSLLPFLAVMTVNSFVPSYRQAANPLLGALFAFTFVVIAAILVRSWAAFRRPR